VNEYFSGPFRRVGRKGKFEGIRCLQGGMPCLDLGHIPPEGERIATEIACYAIGECKPLGL
jgi:hypothetical protein